MISGETTSAGHGSIPTACSSLGPNLLSCLVIRPEGRQGLEASLTEGGDPRCVRRQLCLGKGSEPKLGRDGAVEVTWRRF